MIEKCSFNLDLEKQSHYFCRITGIFFTSLQIFLYQGIKGLLSPQASTFISFCFLTVGEMWERAAVSGSNGSSSKIISGMKWMHPTSKACLSLAWIWHTQERVCMNRVRSLLSMSWMLLGYSFKHRPNSFVLGTAGLVMTIGLSITGWSHLKKTFWWEKTILTSPEVWALATSKAWCHSGTASFSLLVWREGGSSRWVKWIVYMILNINTLNGGFWNLDLGTCVSTLKEPVFLQYCMSCSFPSSTP